MKISVIIPIYKAEKYICWCLDSVLAQTYKDFEVILVDDGSPDNCPQICDEYVKKDIRVKVIHQKNGGAAAARNTGLDNADGEYISFIDADDWLEPNMLEKLVGIAEQNQADIVKCGFNDVSANKIDICTFKEQKTYTCQQQGDLLKRGCHGGILWSAFWNGIYRKDIIGNSRIPTGFINEDNYFNPMMVYNAQKVIVIPDVLYNYRELADSVSATGIKRPFDRGIAYIHLITDLQKKNFTFKKFDERLASEYYHYICKRNVYVRPQCLNKKLMAFLKKNLSVRRYLLLRYAMFRYGIKVGA